MRFSYTVILAFLCLSVNAEDLKEQQFIDKAMEESKQGNHAEAVSMLTKRIKHKEWQLQFLYRLRAADYSNLKEYEKARDDYIKALPRSKNGDVEWYLGKTYEKLSEPKKAIFYLDKSIELAKDRKLGKDRELLIGFARYYKGRALASLGKFSEAKEVLLKIESNETTKNIMSEVQVMIDFCSEKERLLNELLVRDDNAEGYYNCGFFYAHHGNYEDAFKWYMKAAKQGHAGAQKKLAYSYKNGEGVLQDNVEAYAWALCAEINGQPEAKEALAPQLTSGQITAGQIRAKRKWGHRAKQNAEGEQKGSEYQL
ncbi:MAG: sel1 repeat family protein [Desulfobacterales bacterium]|nr:sel1 repeat family protein [Desulfobacterales bacterium]